MVARAQSPFAAFVTAGEPFRRILLQAERAAAAEVGILVTGETGTGKGLLARAIHEASRRRAGPFVTVDCASLHGGLIQSELFGHRRGAFSGAERDRIGRFEAAQGGTVFLDGIDELDLESQAHLLRAIETREILPLGEVRPRRLDFRTLASAAPELKRRVSEGRFRADLFYRVNVVELLLLPLRERREDIPALSRTFLAERARRFQKPIEGFTPAALRVLEEHDWPGNVRELELAVEVAAASARGELIEESDLPVHVRAARRRAAERSSGAPGSASRERKDAPGSASRERKDVQLRPFAERVEEFQRNVILTTLAKCGLSAKAAAGELGLERHQLKYLCAKLGIRRSAAAADSD
jgi:DNA-binding NtrC family response regulator